MALLETFNDALNRMTQEGHILSGSEWYRSEKLLAVVPDMNFLQWPEAQDQFNNCYNFALNWRTNSRLQPGELYFDKLNDLTQAKAAYAEFHRLQTGKDLAAFADYTISMITRDGLTQIDDIEACEGGFPVALFFRRLDSVNDFHFASLRRAAAPLIDGDILQWAHKPGLGSVQFCSREPANPSGLSSLFSRMATGESPRFAGFFKVAPSVLTASTPGGLTEQRRICWQNIAAAYY